MKKTVKSMVDEAMAAITTYGIEEARELHGMEDVQFVDIRDVRELEREGVIPGAFHAPRGLLEFWVDPESPYFHPVFGQGKRYVLYCALGWRSALATKTLQDMGLDGVGHIEGGLGIVEDLRALVKCPPEIKAACRELGDGAPCSARVQTFFALMKTFFLPASTDRKNCDVECGRPDRPGGGLGDHG